MDASPGVPLRGQATWRNVKKAVRAIPGAAECKLSDLEAMAALCPRVVIVRNRLM